MMYYNPYTHCHELVADFGGAYRLYILSSGKWLILPLCYVSLRAAISVGFYFNLPFLIINECTQKPVFRCATYH